MIECSNWIFATEAFLLIIESRIKAFFMIARSATVTYGPTIELSMKAVEAIETGGLMMQDGKR